jgi:hypothetical protein
MTENCLPDGRARKDVIGISASKGAAILTANTGERFNQFVTPFEAWQGWIEKTNPGTNERLGFMMPEPPTGPALQWGLAFEKPIELLALDQAFGVNSENVLISEQQKFYSRTAGVADMICYIDGIYRPSGILHEAKTTNYWTWRDSFGPPGTDRVPASYQIQVQHMLYCTGLDECILSVLIFPRRQDEYEADGWNLIADDSAGDPVNYVLKVPAWPGSTDSRFMECEEFADHLDALGYFCQYRIRRNDELIAAMVDAYDEWWQRHITGCTPPEPTNYADIIRMTNAPTGTIVLPDEVAEEKRVMKDISGEISLLNKQKEARKLNILNYARTAEKHLDDESRDKWIFLDQRGRKVASYTNKDGKARFT